MKGQLVIKECEVGYNPFHFSVYKDTLYIPEAQLKIYHWQDIRPYGLVERLNQQEFNDLKEVHARDLQEVELDDLVVNEISTLFRKIEPVIPAMREICQRIAKLRK